MSSDVTNGLAFKEAMQAAAISLFDSAVMVSWGHPGNRYPDEVVALMDMRAAQDPATLGTQRGRHERLELDISFLVNRVGSDSSAQKLAEIRVFELLALLEKYCRQTNTTLDGVVLWCALTGYDIAGYTPDDQRHLGWRSELSATFTAESRVTGY